MRFLRDKINCYILVSFDSSVLGLCKNPVYLKYQHSGFTRMRFNLGGTLVQKFAHLGPLKLTMSLNDMVRIPPRF